MKLRGLIYAVMMISVCIGAFCTSTAAQNPSAGGAASVLGWALPVNPPPPPGQVRKPDPTAKHIPNSTVTYTGDQIRDDFSVPDWHPDQHPPLPDPVGRGRRPDVRACGFCHLPEGEGRPDNASLAGLPTPYIEQQVADIKSGARNGSRKSPMTLAAKAITPEELKAAAAYFAGLKPKPWIHVVETNAVPKTRVAGNMWVPLEEGAMEPIGQRIIETAEHLETEELRDSNSGYVAYVPVGSVKKGEELVKTGGGGKTIRCTICHGEDLKGLAYVPGIAGRGPSYLARQLYDMQSGLRNGAWTPLMKEVVAKLTPEDVVNITAYISSLAP